MVETIADNPVVIVEVDEYALYCAQCCNGRTQIRPGGIRYTDRVPCSRCRPAAYAAAIAESDRS